MNRRIALLLAGLLTGMLALAQDAWDLRRCVMYALTNNVSIRQADVQARIAALQLKQSEASRYPSLNLATSAGYNLGRSINPTTNAFESRSVFFQNLQLQSGVDLFNWFSKRYTIEANALERKAADATLDKARNDVALNVAVAYLQALLANEQVEITVVQIQQTAAQLEVVRKQVQAGALPELNAVEVEAQLARDSATYIGAVASYQQNLIQLKALINLDMAQAFDIPKPDVSAIPVDSLVNLQPEYVYQQALKNLPQQRANQLRYEAALRSAKAARATMYPTLSAFAQIGSNYSSAFPDQERAVISQGTGFDTVGLVQLSPTDVRYAVRPKFNYFIPNTAYGRQLFDVNLRQAIGLNLSVPIFNGRQQRTFWERARLNAESLNWQMERDRITLQQDIYSAYNNAVNAQQRYRAAQKAAEAADKAFGFSQKRYNVGLLPTFELLTNQNNLSRSRLDAVAARYEYVFRLKLLEFYKGEGLRL